VYGVVLNGPGYTSRETDRFKDLGGRVTLTPFINGHSFFRTLSITPWGLKGYRASDFIRKKGTVTPVTGGQQKDRYGVHLGIKDPRITLATQLAWRTDIIESADTLVDATPTATPRDGRLISAYAIAKPLTFFEALPSWPVLALVRVDQIKPDANSPANALNVIAGLGYDLNKKAQLWIDFVNQDPRKGSTAADIKTFLIQAIVNF
jgi:hypothetical protein